MFTNSNHFRKSILFILLKVISVIKYIILITAIIIFKTAATQKLDG